MSTVKMDVPDDLDDDLERFLEANPHFENTEDLLVTILRGLIEADEATANTDRAVDASERGERKRAIEALQNAQESNERAMEALLESFGIEPPLSPETEETIRQSEEDFQNGDYVALGDV